MLKWQICEKKNFSVQQPKHNALNMSQQQPWHRYLFLMPRSNNGNHQCIQESLYHKV